MAAKSPAKDKPGNHLDEASLRHLPPEYAELLANELAKTAAKAEHQPSPIDQDRCPAKPQVKPAARKRDKPAAKPAKAESKPSPKKRDKPAAQADDKPHFLGHRERLRDRYAKGGSDALPDYEFLELLLFRSIPRADTKPIAKALLARFGSLAEVLGAPTHLLEEVKGVGSATAFDLKLIAAAGQRTALSQIRERPVLSSWSQVIAYCKAAMSFRQREQFRILFLDKKNMLIADEVLQEGTVDHTPVYPREVVRRALELSASALILAHNHPSGDPTPSRADIEMTKTIIETAKPLGISVHDHVIIGKGSHVSMKGLQLI